MHNFEACEEGKIKEEELLGEKIVLCYSEERCHYKNRFIFEFDGYYYPICKSHGLKENKLAEMTQAIPL